MGKNKYIWIIGIILIVGALFLVVSKSKANGFVVLNDYDGDITIYKSETCGCCSVYGSYFKGQGNSNVEITNADDVDFIKEDYGVPAGLASCHTTIIGDYFVEGHVPLEAINRLLEVKPDIAGIAMPGMPGGSPGMPGAKTREFIIYAVNHDGTYGEFMRI